MTYSDLEEAVISELKKSVPALRLVEPYAGQLEEEVKELTVRLPAAFIVHDESEFIWVDGSAYREDVRLSVMVVERVARSGSDRAVIEAVTDALAHQGLGLQMERLMPVRGSLLYTDRLLKVHALEFITSFDRNFNKTEEVS
jgi:hypothetical protein